MGGIGSGLVRHFHRRPLTTDLLSLDIRTLAKSLDFRSDFAATCTWIVRGEAVGSAGVKSGAGVLVLSYQIVGHGAQRPNVTASVPLVWSRCTLGGERPWLLCPREGCGRRVAILYCGVGPFCRRCLGLAYPSQRESASLRAHRRAGRIRHRLEGRCDSFSDPLPVRPKGMHRQTFFRLCAEHHRLMDLYFTGETKRLELLLKRFDSM